MIILQTTAEAERFELSMPCDMPPFQGGGINRYPTPPINTIYTYLTKKGSADSASTLTFCQIYARVVWDSAHARRAT